MISQYARLVTPSGTPEVSGSFLHLLRPDDASTLTGLGWLRRYRTGSRVILQGDDGDTVFLILEGRVKVTLDTAEGRETVLGVLGPGELLGEFEAIDTAGGPRTASNVALEPLACRVFTGDEFRAYLESHPLVAPVLLRVIIRRLRAADQRRADAGSLDTAHRLARFLVELADQRGQPDADGIGVDIPLTQDELASLIAASRESVVRALTSLRARRLIATARRRITIRDLDSLRAYARC